MRELEDITDDIAVVVSNSRLLSYLATVYTRHDAFAGHGYLTPNVEANSEAIKALQRGELIEDLSGYSQLLLWELNNEGWEYFGDKRLDRVREAYEKAGYEVAKIASKDTGPDWVILYCKPPASSE